MNIASRDLSHTADVALVDLSKIKPGDEVTVRGRVMLLHLHRSSPGPALVVEFQQPTGGHSSWSDIDVAPETIVSHAPRTLAVGDMVRGRSFRSALRGEVLALDGEHAWVHWAASTFSPEERRETCRLDELERAS